MDNTAFFLKERGLWTRVIDIKDIRTQGESGMGRERSEQARKDGTAQLTEMNPLTKIHQPSFSPDPISRDKSTL
jgi:hypothetical protein